MSAVREFPVQSPIVETGVVRFGDDYSGVFIRGKDAWLYGRALELGAAYLKHAKGYAAHAQLLVELRDLFGSCIESDPNEDRAA